MNRRKIQFPDEFIFSTEIKTQITDLNYGRHVGNDVFLKYLNIARVDFFKSFNQTEENLYGSGIITLDAHLIYKKVLLDQGITLVIDLAIDDVKASRFDLFYRIKEKNSDELVLKAVTSIGFVSYEREVPISAPDEFLRKFGKKK